MEWVLALQYGSGLFWIFGLPVYLVLASVSYGYYNVINIYGFSSYISVQFYDTPVNGTLEQEYNDSDQHEYLRRMLGASQLGNPKAWPNAMVCQIES